MKRGLYNNILIVVYLLVMSSCTILKGRYFLNGTYNGTKSLVLGNDKYELYSEKTMGVKEYSEGIWILKKDTILLLNNKKLNDFSFSFNALNSIKSDSFKICGNIIPNKFNSVEILFTIYNIDSSINYFDFDSDSCLSFALKNVNRVMVENIQTQEKLFFFPMENKTYNFITKSSEYLEYDTLILLKEKGKLKDFQTNEYFIKE